MNLLSIRITLLASHPHPDPAKQPLPKKPTKVHPLASTSKNEAILSELKDTLFDIFAQIGQNRRDNRRKQKLPVVGDGLTYEKILHLQELLQFEENEFESLELLDPLLAWWHTVWTDLSGLCETH